MGADGIGLSLANRFADEGALVRLCHIIEKDPESTASRIHQSGGHAEVFVGYITSPRAPEA